jgi:iron(III) transport system permease protein
VIYIKVCGFEVRKFSAVSKEAPNSFNSTRCPAWRTDRRNRLLERALPAAAVAVGLLLVAGPFMSTAVRSVTAADTGLAFSLDNFAGLFFDRNFLEALRNTVLSGLGATLFSCLLGFTLAWIVARTDIFGRGWFEVLNLVPFFLSPYVGAVAWLYLAAPNAGLLQNMLGEYRWLIGFLNIYSIGGVVFVLSLFYTPYVYLLLIGPMRRIDGALEDAARVHGASFATTLRTITIPLLMPSLMSGALIVFVTSAGLFDVPLALASPKGIHTIPTDIYAAVQYPTDFGRAAALGVLMMSVTVLFTTFQRRYMAKRRFHTVSGKGYRPRPANLGPAGRAAALAVEIAYLSISVVLPVIAMVLVSLSSIWSGRFRWQNATLGNFDYVLFNYSLTQNAVKNSLILAVGGATVGVAIGFLQAYYLRDRGGFSRRFVEPLLSLPLGIPGIILGLGFLILLIRTPLYGTLAILLIAYVAHFYPFAMRGIGAMFFALNPELEQSARASGATWLQTMWMVVLPLVRPAIIAAWLMLFVIFIRELGATILLYASGTETISVALVQLSERSFGYVAALAIVQIALLLGAFTLFKRTGASILEG